MKKIVAAAVTIVLLLVISLAVAQPWISTTQRWPRCPQYVMEIGYTEITQTYLEGKAPSGGYVKLTGPDVNTDVPDDCILTIYDATFSNFGDVVARCDFIGRDSGGSTVFRNQVLFIGPKESLALSFPEGRFLTEGGYVEVGCLEGGPVWATVNGHLGCWKSLKESKEEPGTSTDVQPGIALP